MPAPTFSDIHNRLNRLPILKDDKSLRTKLEARYGNEPGGYHGYDEQVYVDQAVKRALSVNGGIKSEATSYDSHIEVRYRNSAIDVGAAVWKVASEKYCVFWWDIQLD